MKKEALPTPAAKTNATALVVPPPQAATGTGTNDIRDIKAPVAIPSNWAWLGWALVGAALVALLWAAWRRWRRKQSAPVPEVIIPPHERARKRLEEALRWINEPKLFCTAVSDALRLYLEERFGLRAPERTTEEFLFELQSAGALSSAQKQSLALFLEHCDLVKFARAEPPQTALMDLHGAALRLVSETEPPPLAKPGEVPPKIVSRVESSSATSPLPSLSSPSEGEERVPGGRERSGSDQGHGQMPPPLSK